MRQMASGFALGSASIALLFLPLLMVAVNQAPDYSTALQTVIQRSGITEPLLEAAAQVEQYRDNLMHPYNHYIRRGLFPRIR